MKIFICIVALAAAVMGDASLEKTLRESNDQFTAKMFTEVVKTQPGKSMVMSAFSTLSPLAQLALASVGETHDETLKTIGFSNDNVTKDVFADVNRRLRSVDGIELKLANRIYVKQGSELNEQFAAISRDVFASDVKNVDFSKNVQTAAEINSWVEENTNNRIKDLVNPDSLTVDTAAVLVNAIYFKGKWKHQFNTQYTKEADFHMTKDKTVKVQMMSTSKELKYGESQELDAKLLELPYEGDTSSLLVMLPNEIDGINSMIEKLKDSSTLNKAVEKMSYYDVDVSLPRFKIETTTNLKDVLTKMGCKRLFTPGEARLDNLLKGNSDLYISEAIQKAFIEVNEEGAEAAAANVVTPVVAVMANSSSEKILQQSNEQFSARMNRIILKSRPEKSTVWSTFSLLSPLANLAMGSVEETHDEILQTIGFPNDNVTMEVFTDVNRRLRSVEEIEFNVANGIYVKKGQTLNEEFVAMSKNTFGTDIRNVDFSKNVETAAGINSWVASNTDHRINDLINPDTLLENETAILLNAVSFKGNFKYPFNMQNTKEADFHVTQDKTIKVQMMHLSGQFLSGLTEDFVFKVLELPYVDSKGSVVVLLPDDILNAESLLSAFNAPLNYTILELESYEVDISLPRFRIETTTNLIEVFTEMGCKRFITPNEAQLDNLLKGNGNLYISEAIQKAVIEVDEQGDETYDANDFGTKSQSAVLPQKIIFNADHPFLFFVKKDDNILLSGVFQPYSDDD